MLRSKGYLWENKGTLGLSESDCSGARFSEIGLGVQIYGALKGFLCFPSMAVSHISSFQQSVHMYRGREPRIHFLVGWQ